MGYIGEPGELRKIRVIPARELDPAQAPVTEPAAPVAPEPVPA